jgi:hypothetical protein
MAIEDVITPMLVKDILEQEEDVSSLLEETEIEIQDSAFNEIPIQDFIDEILDIIIEIVFDESEALIITHRGWKIIEAYSSIN